MGEGALAALENVLRLGTDDQVFQHLRKYRCGYTGSLLLFENYAPAVEAFETSVLRSQRGALWKRLLSASPPLIDPGRFLAPRALRETAAGGAAERKGRDLRGEKDAAALRRAGCLTVAEAACKLTRGSILELFLPALSRGATLELLTAACGIGTAQMVATVLDAPLLRADVAAAVNEYVVGGGAKSDVFPLHSAIESSREPARKVQLLIGAGADVNAPTRQSVAVPPLLLAAGRGDPQLVRILLGEAADPNAAVAALGLPTALFHAVYWGFEDVVRAICESGRVDWSLQSTIGETVFQTAANALQFAKLKKPSHIQRLPLPKTPVPTCERIIALLEQFAAKDAAAEAERAAEAAAAALGSGDAVAVACSPTASPLSERDFPTPVKRADSRGAAGGGDPRFTKGDRDGNLSQLSEALRWANAVLVSGPADACKASAVALACEELGWSHATFAPEGCSCAGIEADLQEFVNTRAVPISLSRKRRRRGAGGGFEKPPDRPRHVCILKRFTVAPPALPSLPRHGSYTPPTQLNAPWAAAGGGDGPRPGLAAVLRRVGALAAEPPGAPTVLALTLSAAAPAAHALKTLILGEVEKAAARDEAPTAFREPSRRLAHCRPGIRPVGRATGFPPAPRLQAATRPPPRVKAPSATLLRKFAKRCLAAAGVANKRAVSAVCDSLQASGASSFSAVSVVLANETASAAKTPVSFAEPFNLFAFVSRILYNKRVPPEGGSNEPPLQLSPAAAADQPPFPASPPTSPMTNCSWPAGASAAAAAASHSRQKGSLPRRHAVLAADRNWAAGPGPQTWDVASGGGMVDDAEVGHPGGPVGEPAAAAGLPGEGVAPPAPAPPAPPAAAPAALSPPFGCLHSRMLNLPSSRRSSWTSCAFAGPLFDTAPAAVARRRQLAPAELRPRHRRPPLYYDLHGTVRRSLLDPKSLAVVPALLFENYIRFFTDPGDAVAFAHALTEFDTLGVQKLDAEAVEIVCRAALDCNMAPGRPGAAGGGGGAAAFRGFALLPPRRCGETGGGGAGGEVGGGADGVGSGGASCNATFTAPTASGSAANAVAAASATAASGAAAGSAAVGGFAAAIFTRYARQISLRCVPRKPDLFERDALSALLPCDRAAIQFALAQEG